MTAKPILKKLLLTYLSFFIIEANFIKNNDSKIECTGISTVLNYCIKSKFICLFPIIQFEFKYYIHYLNFNVNLKILRKSVKLFKN